MEVRLGGETLLFGTVSAVEDTATVLGNLVDNAITAAAAAGEEPGVAREVEVTLMDEGQDLVLTVADTGDGISAGTELFAARPATADTVHGHGIGLRLSRELVQRRGGSLWVIDPGGREPGQGAVFGVRLVGVMAARSENPDGARSTEAER